jgi:hypothetical protein
MILQSCQSGRGYHNESILPDTECGLGYQRRMYHTVMLRRSIDGWRFGWVVYRKEAMLGSAEKLLC